MELTILQQPKLKPPTWTSLNRLLKHCEIRPTSIRSSQSTRCLLWKTGQRFVGQIVTKPTPQVRTSKALRSWSFRMDTDICGCDSLSKNCLECSQAQHVALSLCVILETSSWTKVGRKWQSKTWNSLARFATSQRQKLTLSVTSFETWRLIQGSLWFRLGPSNKFPVVRVANTSEVKRSRSTGRKSTLN